MSKKSEDEPREGEVTLWVGSFSPLAQAVEFLICLLLTLLLPVLAFTFLAAYFIWLVTLVGLFWLAAFGRYIYKRISANYKLTSQRFIHERGILNRHTDRVETLDIEDVSYDQNLIDRMLGVGSLKITSKDPSHPDLTIPGVPNVEKVAELLDKARRQERLEHGVQIRT